MMKRKKSIKELDEEIERLKRQAEINRLKKEIDKKKGS